mgnify:CR=1 FL=1
MEKSDQAKIEQLEAKISDLERRIQDLESNRPPIQLVGYDSKGILIMRGVEGEG